MKHGILLPPMITHFTMLNCINDEVLIEAEALLAQGEAYALPDTSLKPNYQCCLTSLSKKLERSKQG